MKAKSDQPVDKLRAAGRTMVHLAFDDERHEFSRQENVLKPRAWVASFLVQHLPSAK